MNQSTSLTTARLLIEPLTLNDSNFIFELVNTQGWLEFIGSRNITSLMEAMSYTQKIIDSPTTVYWVVKLPDKTAIGVISFIKRDYLPFHDIGFAFLPRFANKGYAHEAAKAVLDNLIPNHSTILATTLPENVNSIKLLKKLGLDFEKEIENVQEKIHVYTISSDKLSINEIVKSFFELFTNINNKQPNWKLLSSICIPEIIIIRKIEADHTVYNLTSFIEPRQKILTDGTLTEFEEHEIREKTKIINNIAQRYSDYEKSGILQGNPFQQKGYKFFQFVKTNEGWRISSVIWEDEKS